MKITGTATYAGQIASVGQQNQKAERDGNACTKESAPETVKGSGTPAAAPVKLSQAGAQQPLVTFTRGGEVNSIFTGQSPSRDLLDPRLQTAKPATDALTSKLGIQGPESRNSEQGTDVAAGDPLAPDGQKRKVGERNRDERHPAPDSPDDITKPKPFESQEDRLKRDLDQRFTQYKDGARSGLEEKGLNGNLADRWFVGGGRSRPQADAGSLSHSTGSPSADPSDLDLLKQRHPDPSDDEGMFGGLPAAKDPRSVKSATELRASLASEDSDRVGPTLRFRDRTPTGGDLWGKVSHDSQGRPHLEMGNGEKVRSKVHEDKSFDSLVVKDGNLFNVHYSPKGGTGGQVIILKLGDVSGATKSGGGSETTSGAGTSKGGGSTDTQQAKTKPDSAPNKKPDGNSKHEWDNPSRPDPNAAGDLDLIPMRDRVTTPVNQDGRAFDIERLVTKTVAMAMSKVNPRPDDGPERRGPIVLPTNPVADPPEEPGSHAKPRPPRPDRVGPIGGGGSPIASAEATSGAAQDEQETGGRDEVGRR